MAIWSLKSNINQGVWIRLITPNLQQRSPPRADKSSWPLNTTSYDYLNFDLRVLGINTQIMMWSDKKHVIYHMT